MNLNEVESIKGYRTFYEVMADSGSFNINEVLISNGIGDGTFKVHIIKGTHNHDGDFQASGYKNARLFLHDCDNSKDNKHGFVDFKCDFWILQILELKEGEDCEGNPHALLFLDGLTDVIKTESYKNLNF